MEAIFAITLKKSLDIYAEMCDGRLRTFGQDTNWESLVLRAELHTEEPTQNMNKKEN